MDFVIEGVIAVVEGSVAAVAAADTIFTGVEPETFGETGDVCAGDRGA